VPKAIVVLAVVGAVLLVTGCGDDDSSISKQEYDQKIELVCNKGLKEHEEVLSKISKEFEEQGQKASDDFKAKNLRKLIAVYEDTTGEIDDIGLPEQSEKKAEELVQSREDAAAKVDADPLGTIESLSTIFEKPNEIAEDLGAKSCAT
jgi:hypothetical protein